MCCPSLPSHSGELLCPHVLCFDDAFCFSPFGFTRPFPLDSTVQGTSSSCRPAAPFQDSLGQLEPFESCQLELPLGLVSYCSLCSPLISTNSGKWKHIVNLEEMPKVFSAAGSDSTLKHMLNF